MQYRPGCQSTAQMHNNLGLIFVRKSRGVAVSLAPQGLALGISTPNRIIDAAMEPTCSGRPRTAVVIPKAPPMTFGSSRWPAAKRNRPPQSATPGARHPGASNPVPPGTPPTGSLVIAPANPSLGHRLARSRVSDHGNHPNGVLDRNVGAKIRGIVRFFLEELRCHALIPDRSGSQGITSLHDR
jgi:hypothetical protein